MCVLTRCPFHGLPISNDLCGHRTLVIFPFVLPVLSEFPTISHTPTKTLSLFAFLIPIVYNVPPCFVHIHTRRSSRAFWLVHGALPTLRPSLFRLLELFPSEIHYIHTRIHTLEFIYTWIHIFTWMLRITRQREAGHVHSSFISLVNRTMSLYTYQSCLNHVSTVNSTFS